MATHRRDITSQRASDERIRAFRARVLARYAAAPDERGYMPWRQTSDPYRVWLSEVMLQQTQVSRVLPKYEAWLERFPDVQTLAAAPLETVLESWQGLGYNRRAVALKRAAEQVVAEHDATVPSDEGALRALPGIGPATAAGIRVFAYGASARYLETNVRAALLHEFFADATDVPDSALAPLLDELIPDEGTDTRTWYYALMDYGAHIKRTQANPSRRSRHHTTQSRFEGSHRQKRARLLRVVMEAPGQQVGSYAEEMGIDIAAAEGLVAQLEAEGFLENNDGTVRVAE